MDRSHLPATGPGSRTLLPALELARRDGSTRSLRRGRGPRVVFVRHAEECVACDAYLADLVSEAAAGDWGVEIVAVVQRFGARAADGVTWLEDPDGAAVGRPLALIVADEWGEVFVSMVASRESELPKQEEVTESVRYVAIQCPECEGPEGLWREL